MKRCPTCQRTYDDDMKFCQTDGTPLINGVESQPPVSDDSYKTVLDGQFNNESSEQSQNDLLEIDSIETNFGAVPPRDLPPSSPFDNPQSSQQSNLTTPSFGDLSSPQFDSAASRDSITSNTPTFKEPDAPFGQNFGQQSFGQDTGAWSPPPAPQGWGNQGLGQNTPFSPPVFNSEKQNQTLAIVSLVLGILSVMCCGLITGIPAIITGYIAKNNAEQNANAYGGRGLALAGMILGGISILFSLLYFVYLFISIIENSH